MTDSLRDQALDEAKRLVSNDRNTEYGEPIDNFTKVVEALNALGYRGPGGRLLTPHDLPVIQIVTKLSRLVQTPDKADSWIDISGYGALGREVSEQQKAEQTKYATGGLITAPVSVYVGAGKIMRDYSATDKDASSSMNEIALRDEKLLEEHGHKIVFKWLPASEFGGTPTLRMSLPLVLATGLSKETIQRKAEETAFASNFSLSKEMVRVLDSGDTIYFVWESLPIPFKDANAR